MIEPSTVVTLSGTVKFTSLHHLKHELENPESVDIDKESDDLREYIIRLIEDIKNRNSKRKFEFRSHKTEVRSAITDFINDKYLEASETNSNRLLKVEKNTQKTIEKLKTNIQKGSLFQAVIENEDSTKIIIIGKADHSDYLDASDLKVHDGMPWNKRIFKSFLAIVTPEGFVDEVLVSDTTSTLSRYWWNDFLELSEIRTDKVNTKSFLERIERWVLNPIKETFPSDHIVLKNSVSGFFQSNDIFDLDILYETVFKNYTPKNEKLPISKLSTKLLEIPIKYNLDTQFTIDKNEIKKKSRNIVVLNESLELTVKGGADLRDIETYKDEEGNKFIIIKTELGYQMFKK